MPDDLEDGEALRNSLRIVVRPVDRLRSLVTGGAEIATVRVHPDLVGLLVSDLGDHTVYLTVDRLAEAELTAPDAVQRALEQTWVHEIGPRLTDHGDGPIMLTCGGHYEASLLLYDHVWEQLAPHVDGDVVVAVPARDLVFVTGSRDREGLKKLEEIVDDAYERDLPHLLTPRLARRTGDDWERWPPPPKECDACGRRYALSRTVCLDCDQGLDDAAYTRAVLFWLGIAALFEGGLYVSGGRTGGGLDYLGDAVQTAALLILVGWPLFKLVQKLREPARPVLRELGSLYADRVGRGLVVALVGFVAYLWHDGFDVPLVPVEASWIGWFDLVRIWGFLVVGGLALLVTLLDQGLQFFDPRVRHTYSRRERRDLERRAAPREPPT